MVNDLDNLQRNHDPVGTDNDFKAGGERRFTVQF